MNEDLLGQNPTSANEETADQPTSSLTRRAFLTVPAAIGLGAIADRFGSSRAEGAALQSAPAFILQADRPTTPSGVASGDVTDDSAIVWSRTDRPSRLFLDWSTTSDFGQAQRIRGPLALPS